MKQKGKWATSRDYEQRVLTGAQCKACDGKIEYLDKRSAKLTIRRMKGRSGRLNAYPCPESEKRGSTVWHIGHPPSALKAGAIARDQIKRKKRIA